MLISDIPSTISYVYTGVDTFPVPFSFYGLTTVKVGYRADSDPTSASPYVPLVYEIDYTVTGVKGSENDGDQAFKSGSVTLTSVGAAKVPSNGIVVVMRETPLEQQFAYNELDNFPAKSHENGLGRQAVISQEITAKLSRVLMVPPGADAKGQDLLQTTLSTMFVARDAAQAAEAAAGHSAAEAAASANTAAQVVLDATENAINAAAQVVLDATENAINAATTQADQAQGAANAAATAASTAADDARQAIAEEINRASDEADRASTEADRAKNEADRAQSLANVGPATPQQLGMVRIGEGIAITEDGAISVTPVNLATTERPGTVRPGSGMTIDAGGALHIAYWDAFPPYVPIPIWGVTFGGSDGRRAIMPGEAAAREDWILCDGGNDGKGGTMPNLAGRTLLGADASHVAGTIGGSGSHSHTVVGSAGNSTLSVAQLASHNHSYTLYKTNTNVGYNSDQFGAYNQITAGTTGSTGSNEAHTHTLSATASSASNFMPFCALHFVMRVI